MARAARREAAFTLIEILAVVAIFALMAAFIMPNLGVLGSRALSQQGERLASQLELARQRSVMTSISHRILIDLEAGAYRIEWQGPDPESEAFEAAPEPDPLRPTGALLDLSPPIEEQRDYLPLPGMFGRFSYLESDLSFAGVETPEGWIERGEVSISFDQDGTSEYAEIVLDNSDGATLTLDVMPLADAVRIRSDAL